MAEAVAIAAAAVVAEAIRRQGGMNRGFNRRCRLIRKDSSRGGRKAGCRYDDDEGV